MAEPPKTDSAIAPAGVEPPPVSVSIQAVPLFCCDSLKRVFSAVVDGNEPIGARFTWDFGDGHSAGTQTATHTFAWPGSYVVTVTLHPQWGQPVEANLEVTVGDGSTAWVDTFDPNSVPDESIAPAQADDWTVDAGADRVVRSGGIVVLTANTPEGPETGATFRWTQRAGPAVPLSDADSAVLTFTAPNVSTTARTLVFEVRAVFGDLVATDEVQVAVHASDTIAVMAVAGNDRTVGAGEVIPLSGTASSGTGTEPLTFAWVQIVGPEVTIADPLAASTSFVAPAELTEPVTLTFELTVRQGTEHATDAVEFVVVPDGSDVVPDVDRLAAAMRGLPVLPKVHFAWPFNREFLDDPANDPLLREYVRISGAACVWGEFSSPEIIDRMMGICRRIASQFRRPPPSLGVVLRPWQRFFPVDAPPTYVGPEHDEEIAYFEQRLAMVRDWVDQNNALHDTQVSITTVLLECERFKIKDETDPDHEAWNLAVDEKHDLIWLATRRQMPEVRIEWFSRGASRYFTFRELGDAFSVPLYRATETRVYPALFDRVETIASFHDTPEVTPWIALGAAYLRDENNASVWSFDTDYPLQLSADVAAFVQSRDAATIAVFWPPPFDHRVLRWGDHFIAYVSGANGLPIP